jgi:plastocyanin
MLAISVLALAACSDDGGGATPDASRADAQTPWVVEVTCPATSAASFVTTMNAFSPTAATISVGQTVKFESSSLEHPIGPFNGDPSLTDPALVVPAGRTRCFTFMRPGTFKFICSAHFYVGTLTIN